MKSLFSLFFCSIIFLNSCAQQKVERPPKFPPKKYTEIKKGKKIESVPKPTYVLTLGKLKQNKDSLYCGKNDDECNIIDGKITLFSPSIARGDNASVTERLYAEGEFMKGKYQGIWKYYDKNKKVIKKEKWDNGKLVYRKEYK
ncbi:Uncharacterised protein [Chryseobacterium nakagawai]|uniref:MORN repeat variant n=1 Tax=Chryseobacterium nakagawai TaxID=1241982 RepID=A0AAD0YPB4_CHRNA|nr:hypothetical protein [Chryseobacterium nakagawai]AZA92609.1 hypothetical protein EG343_19405 [Chryseobacterium nakagawai]VEH19206.1 Uncharacterised protein [Chryseobacterium nakagawai]